MSIEVLCPNGHALHVKEAYAGRVGLCPLCKARIEIPAVHQPHLTEEAILAYLGPVEASRGQVAQTSVGAGGWDPHSPVSASPPKKSCEKCNREILATTHICPFCHTYIAGLTDF